MEDHQVICVVEHPLLFEVQVAALIWWILSEICDPVFIQALVF